MEIVIMNLKELNPASYNPRKELASGDVEYEQIKNSILTYGMVEPIVWNRQTGNVVGGHQRLTVLRDLGYEEVEVSVIDVSEAQEKALNIALNKIVGEWDDEKLAVLLDELAADADEMLLSLTGFTEAEIGELFMSDEDLSALLDDSGWDNEADEDALLEEAAENPFTQRGDIYILGGKHRLMCGNATDAGDIERLMDGRSAQLTVTDPPYNVDYTGVAGKMLNDKQSDAEFLNFLRAAFTNIYKASVPGAAVYIFHAESKGLNFRRAFEESGFQTRQCLVWVKNSFVLGRQDYQWKHEPILYGWKDGDSHYFADDRTQTTVIEHDRPTVSKEHPTMKPLALVGKLIENSSKEGWVVLDLFGGSGSTLIASEVTGRICCTMEVDEKYCDVIVRRYIKHSDDANCVELIRNGMTFPYAEVSADV